MSMKAKGLGSATNRRRFIQTSFSTGWAGVVGFPTIVPSTVFGQNSPGNRIQVGQLGCGRIGRSSEIPGILKHDMARIVAVCDLDSQRLKEGKQFVESMYARKLGKDNYREVKTFGDYREMLKDPGIDAVAISTPDHWHAQPTMEAALAGKDIYLQKPNSLTILEGRLMSDTVSRTGRILQIGSQQRSQTQFRVACELVRNGRIGKVKTIRIGLPVDPAGEVEVEMPVPPNLNYDMWLGSTPFVYYTEKRVHPGKGYDRPGWLRCEQFGAGMITGWGAHHLDIAHWGMGTEMGGPIEIKATAEFPKKGLWNVHGTFHAEAQYANGALMIVDSSLPNGIRFEGENGWIFVSRGDYVATSSDPTTGSKRAKALDASDPKILDSVIGPNEIHLPKSQDHHGDWLNSVRTRQAPIAPVEVGHRSCTACLLIHAAMKLKRTLKWDPVKERFPNDDEANRLLKRPQRAPYGTDRVTSKVP